ncbi:Ribonuclease E [Rubellimicrobium mesophilum DSM 19309]|uniref:Ribonuclease E n=1 Tax=Rubellimicrobium mesophilum DSM 19309 TaxID=442562 RepID=A0A017HR03_9RHOB|nr:ribonuclease E/G [Rubellimicrobium mesophilum]EYD76760.1 Ribonuclease E [Rubellimicrobium mesophilum DSM 19309]
MAKKMLIDATHPEETRVVVVDGNRVEDFDFESASKRQLAGNIYLAKVTRVEPSLQAAFVDYGGNRHGFLAFAEIHPDYYQIPVADRQALLAEERALAEQGDEEDAAEEVEESRSEDRGGERRHGRRGRVRSRARALSREEGDAVATREPGQDPAGMETIDLGEGDEDSRGEDEGLSPMATVSETPVETPAPEDRAGEAAAEEAEDSSDDGVEVVEKDETIETVAEEEDHLDLRPRQKPQRARRYKIQEVVKVRQIMLVQVVKEERGNKGAALTTYLSLAGRYCVLMPNTARGGGISRKITNAADRKKLKEIASELDVPEGAGLIIRTAGSQRTKPEIKRDYEYLQRLWEQIRELTLKSIAPAKIYEEGDIIKRSIRDLYSKDIDEVVVEGPEGYRNARDFMKMIMPAHVQNVAHHHEPLPLFARYGVETYLASMFNPVVQLPSGGYIVIGVTEALVAIDVNSGRATKEGSIEQTALKTNLEAADEVARQLRLRDLAGLIVIDFIDMEERKNNAAVEKRFKDKLKTDRARIQVGRISGFGLLEMSRQRLRPGMLESTTQPCPHCHGTGHLRSDDSVALMILRQLDEEGVRGRTKEVLIRVPVGIANYLMNHKREHIAGIEQRYSMAIRVEADTRLISPDFALEKFKTATRAVPDTKAIVMAGSAELMPELDEVVEDDVIVEDDAEETIAEWPETAEAAPAGAEDDRPRKKRRRRRRRRNGERGEGVSGEAVLAEGDDEGDEGEDEDAPDVAEIAEAAVPDVTPDVAAEPVAEVAAPVEEAPIAGAAPAVEAAPAAEEAPAPRRRTRSRKAAEPAPEEAPAEETAPAPKRRSRARKADAVPAGATAPEGEAVAPASEEQPKPAKRPRRSRSGAAVAGEAEVALPVPANPDDEVEAALALDDEPAIDVPFPPGDAPATAEEARDEAERLFEPAPEPAANAPATDSATEPEAPEAPQPEAETPEAEPQSDRPRRRGWWSR